VDGSSRSDEAHQDSMKATTIHIYTEKWKSLVIVRLFRVIHQSKGIAK